MGYRHYLLKMKKKDVNKIRDISLQELKEKYKDKNDEEYVDIDNLITGNVIFEFGKLYWDDTVERIHSTGEKLFKQKDVQEYFPDFDVYLVGKDALKEAIDIYENKIKKMYEELNEEVEKAETFEDKYKLYKQHIRDYEIWWKKFTVIDLEKDAICQSWLYEHLIFELVHLYKTIDFDEYDLIFMGW